MLAKDFAHLALQLFDAVWQRITTTGIINYVHFTLNHEFSVD